MFSIFKRKKPTPTPEPTEITFYLPNTSSAVAATSAEPETLINNNTPEPVPSPTQAPIATQAPTTNETTANPKVGFFSQLWQSMTRTREKLGQGLKYLLTGKRTLDANMRDELETLLLTADLGIDTTDALLDALTRTKLAENEDLLQALARIMISQLSAHQDVPENIPSEGPRIILMVGVNGVGKTTSIAKLAQHFLSQNKKLLLAAGDTFRAAAVDQIKTWGERHQVPVIAQGQDADPASVLYDAVQAAKARQVDILIGDTAGRLHTQGHLMNELKKITRVMQKLDSTAPHECWLVIDATTGQNALNQAKEFHQAIGLTGIILTKLDGTAKGGIVFSLSQQMGLPIRYIGIGEKAEDLRPFDTQAFIHALLGLEK
jgi:fused signal recognition particle receptor